MNIWFTSDTHHGHKNIVRGVSSWDTLQATRPFDTLEEMNQTLIDNINKNVKEDDILYHTGDWSFGGLQNVYEFRKQLKVKTIHLILGNHDHHIENDRTVLVDFQDKLGNKVSVGVSTKSLFTSVQHYLRKKINGQDMVLSHYSMRTWDKGHHGTWMLYGHSHGTLPWYNDFKTMDVGIDTHSEFRPYHFDEIQPIMDKKVPLKVDHHNEQTN
jgi:calcineurin-like phosphoesterase family protein